MARTIASLIVVLIGYLITTAQALKIVPFGGTIVYDMTRSKQMMTVFTCIAPEGLSDEDAQLQWYNPNDIQINDTSGRVRAYSVDSLRMLVIEQVVDSDAGNYTCKGTIDGAATESSIKLELYKGITNTSPLKQYPVRGTDAKIMCNVSAITTHSVRWFTGSFVPIKTGDRFLQKPDHLLVRNIQLNDSGSYVCQCFIPNFTETYNISVTVTIPPKMQGPITQQPPTPKEGEDLLLICLAEGTPAPTYMYYKGNVLLTQEASTNGHYRLEKVTRDNKGIYRCIATNMGGEDSQDVEVDIKPSQALKILPPVGTFAYDMTRSKQMTIVITCIAPEGLSAEDAQLQWYNPNDIQITATYGRVLAYSADSFRILMIEQVVDSDAGTYTCKGTIDGAATESSIKLVLFKGITNTSPLKQYPVRGTDAKIMCNLSVSITHSVRWFTESFVPIKTGDRFLQKADHLLVRNIQLNDSGSYVCQCFIPSLGINEAYNISVTVTTCVAGRYGQDCEERCSNGCNGPCNTTDGTCTCLTGWTGDRCQECTVGLWGASSCSLNCSAHCDGNGTCHIEDGICTQGCRDGWTGSDCDRKLTSDTSGSSGRLVGAVLGAGLLLGLTVVVAALFIIR